MYVLFQCLYYSSCKLREKDDILYFEYPFCKNNLICPSCRIITPCCYHTMKIPWYASFNLHTGTLLIYQWNLLIYFEKYLQKFIKYHHKCQYIQHIAQKILKSWAGNWISNINHPSRPNSIYSKIPLFTKVQTKNVAELARGCEVRSVLWNLLHWSVFYTCLCRTKCVILLQ